MPCQASWAANRISRVVPGKTLLDDEPVQDTHREGMRTHIRGELIDLPRTGAAELAVAQEGPYVVTVVVAGPGLAGTFACTVYPDMAKLRLTRIDVVTAQNKTSRLVRTDGTCLGDLVEFERIEIILNMYRRLLKRDFPEERIGHWR